jgi:hypothetical protein
MLGKLVGEKNPAWIGDNISYDGVHGWIKNKYGKANCCKNKKCTNKSKTFDWANINGEYTRDIKNYIMLCRSCHKRFDLGILSLNEIKG